MKAFFGLRTFCHALPVWLLALWFGGLSWGLDAGMRRFDAHTTATPPNTEDGESWRQARFFVDPDAYCWLSYARDLRASPFWRVRHTALDNAPCGRDMHWSQLPIWSLCLLSWALEKTGAAPPLALELAGRLLLPLFGFIAFSAVYLFLRRRLGVLFAALCALSPAMILFWEFHPFRPDHQAFQIMAAFFFVLPLLFSGFGWSRKGSRPARTPFLLSGLAGGCGLWVGSTVFSFSLGAATLALAWMLGRRASPTSGADAEDIHPEIWRLWSMTGAIVSLFFWLVEYAPGHFAMRLEVNHPLYALSWLGLGEILVLWAQARQQRQPWTPLRAAHALLALAAAAALPALVLFGPGAWYFPRAALMLRLHAHHIHEFLPLHIYAPQNHQSPWFSLLRLIGPGLAALALLCWKRSGLQADAAARRRLTFAFPFFILFTALLLWQIRWNPYAVMASVFLVIAAASALPRGGTRTQKAVPSAWILAGGLSLQLAAGLLIAGIPLVLLARMEKIDPLYFRALQQRNLVMKWKDVAGNQPVRLLAPAEMAPVVYYFGLGDAVAALYWENLAGNTAAAEAFADASPDAARAREIVRERGITHLVMHEGAQDALMFYDLATGRRDQPGAARTLGGILAGSVPGAVLPSWLGVDPDLNLTVNPAYYTFVPKIRQWVPNRFATRLYTVRPTAMRPSDPPGARPQNRRAADSSR